MVLALGDGRQQISPRGGAVHPERFPRGVRDQGLVQGRERAKELAGEGWQVLDDQL